MLNNLKKHIEKAIIILTMAVLLLASAVSWGRILTQDAKPTEIANVDTQQASNKIKRGAMVFAGMIVVVAEYIQLKDDK